MDRKKFLRNGLTGIATATLAPSLAASAAEKTTSTYDRLKASTSLAEQPVGFNHLPNKEEKTMKSVLHRAATRGHANHGWLNTHHSFSFANYHNPERMHFGVLRVLNDDVVAGGRGFGTHPHDNMEIISVPLAGALEHKDSMGNTHVIKKNDIQVMSAGTGIYHSEYNRNTAEETRFLQIWLFPNQRNVKPRYDQIAFTAEERKNKLQQILSPNQNDEGVWIHQNAWFHRGQLEPGFKTNYSVKRKGNGVYAFVIDGKVTINGQELNKRDGFGVWDTNSLAIEAGAETDLLLMEVPMTLS